MKWCQVGGAVDYAYLEILRNTQKYFIISILQHVIVRKMSIIKYKYK